MRKLLLFCQLLVLLVSAISSSIYGSGYFSPGQPLVSAQKSHKHVLFCVVAEHSEGMYTTILQNQYLRYQVRHNVITYCTILCQCSCFFRCLRQLSNKVHLSACCFLKMSPSEALRGRDCSSSGNNRKHILLFHIDSRGI